MITSDYCYLNHINRSSVVGWVSATKPNSHNVCVGFRYRLTQPTIAHRQDACATDGYR